MKKSDSNKTKDKTLNSVNITLIIIAVFCFLIVVFIWYNCWCWPRRRQKRKPKASQRKILNRNQNENGRTESGQLLDNRSQSEDSVDFEERDPGNQPSEGKSKIETKHPTQNSNDPSTRGSFFSRIMSSLPGRGRSSSTDAEASGKNGSNSASTSKQGRSSNKGKLMKSKSYSPERGNKQNSESFGDNKNMKNDKSLEKGCQQQKKNAKRSPTDEGSSRRSPTQSAHEGEKSRRISNCVNKSNCTSSTCKKRGPYNDDGSHIDDQSVGDDGHHGRSGAETESMRNQQGGPATERGRQFQDLGKDGRGRGGDRGNYAARQTNHEVMSRESSRGGEYTTRQTKHEERSSGTGKDSGRVEDITGSKYGRNSGMVSGGSMYRSSHTTHETRRGMRSDGIDSATGQTKYESKHKSYSGGKTDSVGTRCSPGGEPNDRVIAEGYVLIESGCPELNNDQGNGRRAEEHIGRTTANIVECDDHMEVETGYKRDERRNKQDRPTRPREEASWGQPGIGSGRAIETPKHEKRIESIGEMYNVIQYARSEWKSDTVTAQTVREGYSFIPQELGLRNLRVIRGDNYCAIRATLFQVLAKRIPFLDKLQNVEKIPHQLANSRHDSIDDWTFASRIQVPRANVYREMETCLGELSKLVDFISGMDQEEGRIIQLLVNFNCKAFEIEIRLLEAIKFLMFYQATLLYKKMKANKDVPIFAMIMFARDSCGDPWHFMTKHLNYVGDTGGLEQVEMHLLGYTLGVTIKVVRPSHFGQSDYIASYPEDMPDGTPVIALVAEDDRHYNILS